MKKIIIISYFFPPSNFVGGERAYGWSKHFHKYGYFPIIITRKWNENQIEITDKIKNNKLEIEKNEFYEIHRLKYKRTLRDYFSNYEFLKLFQKSLTFIELFLSNFFLKSLPFYNFYKYSLRLIKNQNDIYAVIISGSPFQSFHIGYKLKKKFSKILWVPDYRDEWTTRSTSKPNSFSEKIIFYFNNKSENKWTSNSDFFLTVTEKWRNNISHKISKNGVIIKNGFNYENNLDYLKKSNEIKKDKKSFKIIYIGTLYPYQRIEIFINAIINLINENNNITVYFIGVEILKNELERLKKLTQSYEDVFKIVNKLNKKELHKYLISCDLALATRYENLKGCMPVKIFDYYLFKLPILLCPSDKDEIENFILENKAGYIANTQEECEDVINKIIKKKKIGKAITIENSDNLNNYSRNYQTKLLAKYLSDKKL